MSQKRTKQQGFILPSVLGFIVVITIIFMAVVELVGSNIVLVNSNIQSQKAFNIAEAGVNYYLWHLSHNGTDYKDGQSTPVTPDPTLGYGPYTHNYIDDNAKVAGTFTLWIKPQANSTIVDIRSIGQVANTTVKRTVDAKIGAPSFASYAVVSDTALWFGNTESANGPVHSNQGVRMDGASTSDVTSTNATYTPPSNLGGDGSSKPGVWCHPSVTAPVNCNTRNKSDWRYPVPNIDFNVVDSSLCTMKKVAFQSDPSTTSIANQANACSQTPNTRTAAYLPQRSSSGSFTTNRGYLIELNTNGTYNLFQVNGENDRNTPYTSALTRVSVANNITIPSAGVIFVEDNVWVRSNPTFHGRVTIAAGRLASSSQNTEVTIADDLLYSTKDGSDVIGLVAENSVTIAPYAPPSSGAFNFEINAAMIARSGPVNYPDEYRSANNICTRGWVDSNQTFTFYGSVATRQPWTWTWLWSNACGDNVYDPSSGYRISGILHNTTQYDYNLLYNPPPSWPSTSSYNVLSWREVLTGP
jgi:Tfp pilus assembly protein PilX